MIPIIRRATPDDIPALLEIETQSFSNPWDAGDFRRYECFVAELDTKVAGLLVSRETFPGGPGQSSEHEILNVAVAPDFRRAGIATHLLRSYFKPGAIYFLEVRESNTAACSLYQKLGFAEVGRRPYYYEQPTETAIVMKMKWC